MVSDSLEIYLKYKVVMGVDVGKIGKRSIQDDPMPAKGASVVALITDLAKVVEQISYQGFLQIHQRPQSGARRAKLMGDVQLPTGVHVSRTGS